MRQSWVIVLPAAVLMAGCDGRPAAGPLAVKDGIVSLTPAGTDLLVAMGLGDRVVGVSSFEPNEKLRRRVPKVGDYLRIDFEALSEIRPKFLVVQGRHDRMPAGVRERCTELGVTPVIVKIDRLADIARVVVQIGRAVGSEAAALVLVGEFERREAALDARRAGPAVPALVVFDETGTNAVGGDTFIDDALTLAGGENVVAAKGYPTLDAEKVRSLSPRVTFVLLPAAGPDVVERATKAVAASLPRTRIVTLTDADALMPGTAALRLAETMADGLRAAK